MQGRFGLRQPTPVRMATRPMYRIGGDGYGYGYAGRDLVRMADPDCPLHGYHRAPLPTRSQMVMPPRSGGRSLRPSDDMNKRHAGVFGITYCVSTRITRANFARRIRSLADDYRTDACIVKNELKGGQAIVDKLYALANEVEGLALSGGASPKSSSRHGKPKTAQRPLSTTVRTGGSRYRTGGLLRGEKCSECTKDLDCGFGLVCGTPQGGTGQKCIPRKGPCGLTRRCYGGDKCPCSGNPFTTCNCEGTESTTC